MPSAAKEAHLFNTDPAAYLPHRHPFLLLNRIVELEPGIRAVALIAVTAGHVFPQVYMIESVAQLSGIVVAQATVERGFLASINHAEFSGSPLVGDTLTVSARLIKSFGRLFMVEGTVNNGTGQLLSVQLTLGIGELT